MHAISVAVTGCLGYNWGQDGLFHCRMSKLLKQPSTQRTQSTIFHVIDDYLPQMWS